MSSQDKTRSPDAGAAALDPAVADAIAADLEAIFLPGDEGPETENTPHSLKGGVVFSNPLETNAFQKSYPPSAVSSRKGRKAADKDTLDEVFDAFRFDWVQGVIPAPDGSGECVVGGKIEADAVASGIRFLESIGCRMCDPIRGGKGYEHALPFAEGAGREFVASVASGSHTGGMPNIKLSGGRGFCAVAGPLLLKAFPGLRISRVDSCLDLSSGPDAFDLILEEARKMAKARKMAPPEVLGTQTPEKGRTFYLGAKQSEVRLRVYQKGLQLKSQGEDVDPDWVRIEFQFGNLPSRKKAGFGKLTPGEMVRAYLWPRRFVALIAQVVGLTEGMAKALAAKVEMEGAGMKDLYTSAQHFARQYSKTLALIAIREFAEERCGGDIAAVKVSRKELEERMSEIALRFIRSEGRVQKVMDANRVEVSETPEERAQALADREQAARLVALDRRARSYNRLALTAAAASQDAEAVAGVRQAAQEKRKAADIARADIHDIAADAAKRREAASGAEGVFIPGALNPANPAAVHTIH